MGCARYQRSELSPLGGMKVNINLVDIIKNHQIMAGLVGAPRLSI